MWSANVIILLLCCYACLSTGNGTVYFVSNNFFNVLHWDPVKPATEGDKVLYSVLHRNDVDHQYRIKEECQNITALTCDLTAETPAAPDVHYQAQVLVNGQVLGQTLIRFKPIADTTLGPPTLSTYTTTSTLYVDVILPKGPNGVSIADIISGSKNGPSKAEIIYVLKITEPKWAVLVCENKTGRFAINLKNNKTKYCGHVQYKPSSEWGRKQSMEESFCVTLPGDHRMLLPWLVTGVALLAVMVTISVMRMCTYVKGGRQNKMPKSLINTSSTLGEELKHPFRPTIISKVVVSNAPCDKTVYATIQRMPNVPSVILGGYAPQDIPCPDWKGSTFSTPGTGAHSATTNAQDTSAQSSEIYTAVVVHASNEVEEEATTENRGTRNPPCMEELWHKGGMSPNLTLCGQQLVLPDLDASESNTTRPLVLHTVRDSNGQLMLPSLTFQLENSTDDTMSPFNPERKPLLSDLIDSSEWSDSGCDDSTVNTPTQPYSNTHYTPSPVVSDFDQQCQNTPSTDAIFVSGYKQNWIPT